ncbi:DUF2867 domain-containing protein [candidate division KSB1 bacterium]|nr:DUF2867 domain-containing protein [candidate division KSB1 bacterium]
MSTKPSILLTGATGYIGGRLLRVLQKHGYSVRCMSRRIDALKHKLDQNTTTVYGDPLKKETLTDVFDGIDVAFYFIHSLGSKQSFVRLDRIAAENFSNAAKAANVKRIIYLGGLANPEEELSDHLRSRLEVADYLRQSGIQVIEFRASIIIGSGSLSYEMIRALVERLPVMTTPKWVSMNAQPIAISDVLDYLVQSIEIDSSENMIFEIGGSEIVSYRDLMNEYARQRGLRRLMIPVPVLTPRLSSYWLGLVTPLYARIGKKLIDSIRHSTIIQDTSAREYFNIKPKNVRQSIADALCYEDQEFAETRWSDALSSAGIPRKWTGVRVGNRLVDSRTAEVNVPPEKAFQPIEKIGGDTGWYYANWLWQLRGFLDLLVGGVGMRRGRRDPNTLHVGDAVDFWRVEAIEKNRRLRLQAEMKLPARAWLEFEIEPDGSNGSVIRQTAHYDPVGLFGLVYWYSIYPIHGAIFSGLLKGIVRACEK